MSTENDLVAQRILEILDEKPRLPPLLISKLTGLSHQYVRTTLRTLSELNLVETPARGIYVLTEEGRRHLHKLQVLEGTKQ